MVPSVETAFNWMSILMVKSFETLGTETVNLNIAKAILNKSIINIVLSGDKFSIISLEIDNEIKVSNVCFHSGQYLKIWSSEIKYIKETEIGK